jgi:hypothetical protein
MGARHFTQMYEDAAAADQRALLTAMMMQESTRTERTSKLGNFWKKTPSDKLMDIARKLSGLDDGLTETLKRMLHDGKIHIFMMDHAGKPHTIRDPDVIDFDDPSIADEKFYDAVSAFLADEDCSGQQN